MKKDWSGRGLTVAQLQEELVRLERGSTKGGQRVQLYLADNPRLFEGGQGVDPQAAWAPLWPRLVGRKGGDDDDEALPPAVVVEVLHLGGAGMGMEAAVALAQALEASGSRGTLTKLWLKRNPLTLPGAEAVLRAAAAPENSPHLTSLDFFNAQLGPEAALRFAEVLQHNRKIRHLYLGGNRFGPTGARAMAQMLVAGSALTRLSLDISHLGDEGARSIAAALRQNTSLQYCCLKYNGLTPSGVGAIFDALKDNPRARLETLILGWQLTYDELARKDGVPTEEIAQLANHVGSSSSSSSSNPSGSGGESEGVEALGRLLRAPHCSLTSLNLCRTFLSTEELASIAEAAHHNASLRQLYLFPQTDGEDAEAQATERRIGHQVQEMLKRRGRAGPHRAATSTKAQPQPQNIGAAKPAPSAPPTPPPAVGVPELRRRKKEIAQELCLLEQERSRDAELQTQLTEAEAAAERMRQLQAELASVTEAIRQAKALQEAARKVLRKQKKKQRKEDAREREETTKPRPPALPSADNQQLP